MKACLVAILFLTLIASCKSGTQTIQNKVVYLSELIYFDDIDSILVHNNSGAHLLSAESQSKFINELALLTLTAESGKLRAKGFVLYFDNSETYFAGSTHGNLFEMHISKVQQNKSLLNDSKEDAWLYFETKGMNLDNY